MDNKHYDLSDYPTDQQATGGRVEPVVMCEGGCKTHYGEVKKVRVIDESINKDWGTLSYCESAIAEDINRGFKVLDT